MNNIKFRIIILISLIVFSGVLNLFSQEQAKIDSLLQCLDKAYHDTAKVNFKNDLCNEYLYGDLNKAEDFGRDALDIGLSMDYKRGVAKSYWLLGEVFQLRCEYANANEHYSKALSIYHELDGKKGIANCLFSLGRVSFYQTNYTKANDYYQKSLNIFNKLGDKKGIASNTRNIGLVHYCKGNYPKAIAHYEAALQIFENIGDDRGYSYCLNNLGLVYTDQGFKTKAIECYQNSLKKLEKLGDKKGIAYCYQFLGLVHKNQGNDDEAIEYFQKCEKISRDIGDKYAMSDCKEYTGEIFLKQKLYNESKTSFKKAAEISQQIGDKHGLARSSYLLGKLYLEQKQYSIALTAFEHAYSMFDELGEQVSKAYSNIYIGEAWSKLNNPEKAIDFSFRGLELAKGEGLKSDIEHAYEIIANNYAKQGKFEDAFQYQVLFKEVHDSLFSLESEKKILDLEYRYKLEKKDQEIEQQNLIIAKKQQQTRLSITILTLMLFLGLFGIYDYLKLRRKNKQLFAKNIELTKVEQAEAEMHIANLKVQTVQSVESDTEKKLIGALQLLMLEEKLYTDNSLSLETLADKLETNRTYLSRLINQEFSCNFNKFINKYRIKEARALLVKPEYKNYTIEGVANEVGFNSKSAFNAAFKELTGITPSFYKNEAIIKNAKTMNVV